MIVRELGMNRETVIYLMGNFWIKKVCVKVVPKRKDCTVILQQTAENNEWLNTCITGDES
jgi:hypothetical protein